MSSAPWKSLAHSDVVKLADNLWWVEGTLPGMSLKRAMTVARLGDGRLVIHSAVALDDARMRALEAWGEPAFLLVPNGFHRLDAPAFKARYPKLRVLTPKGSRAKVEQKVAVDGTYDEFPADPSVRVRTLAGVRGIEGVLTVRSPDGETVVLNDAMFNMPKKPSDLLGWFFTTVMASAPGPRTSRLYKRMVVADARAFADDLTQLAATPDLRRLVVSHGEVAHGVDAAHALATAAQRM